MQQAGRLRLRPWLEEQIHSGKYPGVSWLDQSAQIFQISWKHAARHGWSIDRDATLFRSWAVHTGKYHPAKDKPDPKTWKANFRCALNSLSDICELREHSRKRGSNAYRVYKMLPTSQPQRRRRGLRLLSRPRESLTGSGAHTHDTAWLSTTTRPVPDTPQQVDAAAQDTINSTQPYGMWEAKSDEHEQNEAVYKLMDHLGSSEQWSQAGEQRGWRAQTLWDQWHCGAADDGLCLLHPEGYTDLFGPGYIKEFSDCSAHQQH